jgi:acyl-CoA thioester hydrolase
MPPPSCTVELRVRYAETDQMGVVYHANYLVWCEIGRTELIRTFGVSYADLERTAGVGLAVAEASVRYHASARYDDPIRVTTSLAEVRSRTITFDYLITNAASDTRLVTARTTLVGVDRDGRPVRLPPELRATLPPMAD